MPFSIRNDLHHSEVITLQCCNLRKELLAIDRNGDGGPRIVTLSRDEVTCWQLFLRLFGFGKLANKILHLSEVSAYLSRYDWSEARGLKDSSLRDAYGKVCQLANKALLKGSDTLFHNVSLSTTKEVQHSLFEGSKQIYTHTATQNLKWNPFLQVKHVIAYLAMHNPHASISMTERDFTPLENNDRLNLETFKSMRVYLKHIQSAPHVQAPLPRPVAHAAV